MLSSLALVLVFTAVSTGYEALNHNKPSYFAPHLSRHHGYYDYSSSSGSSSSEENRHKKCRKLEELNATPYDGHKPEFLHLGRNGKPYLKISCPNDKKDYALVADKKGSRTTANGGSIAIENSVLLSAGVNINFVVKCHGKRTYAIDSEGDKIQIEKVSCVELKTQQEAC